MIIGLVGFMGSGKGTVGNFLESKGFIKDSFAKPLKDAVSTIFGWSRELLEGDTELSRSWREEPDQFWSEKFGKIFSPRDALQLMGTEAGRDVFNKDLWVISLINRTRGKDVVVTDVRFKNEIEHIQDNDGLVIRIRRDKDPVWFNHLAQITNDEERKEFMQPMNVHASEWDWVGCKFDCIIDNRGTLSELSDSVNTMLTYSKK